MYLFSLANIYFFILLYTHEILYNNEDYEYFYEYVNFIHSGFNLTILMVNKLNELVLKLYMKNQKYTTSSLNVKFIDYQQILRIHI